MYCKEQFFSSSFCSMTCGETHMALLESVYLLKLGSIIHPMALRMAKTLWSFGLSECNRVNEIISQVFTKSSGLHIIKCGNIFCWKMF